MIRKLALAVSIAVGTLPLSVYGLGLGGITTESSLNETFSGQIELLSVPRGELDGILVELASPEIFSKAGVERVFALSGLRFEPVRLANGKAAIKVTSRAPINEPFLDFLIEVNWPKGRIVKEYTVLLDPPATTQRQPAAISQPKTTRTPAPKPTTAARPTGTLSGDQYGPVQANETLWEIAADLKPQGISIHQMMMALQRANPDAFIRGNINLLKRGVVLHVPAAETAADIGQQEAVTSFKNQTDDWMSAPAQPEMPVAEAEPAVEEAVSEQPMAELEAEDAHLKIAPAVSEEESVAGAGEAGAGEEASENLTQQLMLARENAESARQEANELQGQVSTLEEQLDDMQRLLALKDEQLAQMQAGVAAEEAEPAMEAEQAVSGEMTEESTAMPADSPEAETAAESEEAEVVEEEVSEPAPMMTEEAEPVAEPEPEVAAVAVTTQAPKPTSWLEDNMTTLLTVGGGLVGIGVILGLISGSRRRKEDEYQPAVAPTVDDESILVDEQPQAPAAGDHDTSFLSEYSTEDLKALHEDTAEVDAVSEADVYIAYGRYQQAQEILQEALNSDTADHTAVRYKMLEILFATQNRDEFVSLAREMVESGQVDETSEAWQQVKTMGRDLDKNNPLFTEGVSATDAVSQISSTKEDEGEAGDESELSLDLSKLAEELDTSLDEDSEPLAGLESMELDISGFQEPAEPGAEDMEPMPATYTESGELEVDSALTETELHTEMADLSDLAEIREHNDLEDELADLSAEVEGVMADSTILDQPLDLDEEVSSLLQDMDEELNEAVEQADAEELVVEDSEPESILGEESATKLELAQAYIEMGDREGAVSILQEVEEDGTEEQKEAASRLLSDLNE